MLHPHDRDPLPTGLLHEPTDVGDNCVPLVGLGHDAGLDVYNEQGGVRPVPERRHPGHATQGDRADLGVR
jgi:hypothetical protein